MTQEVSPALGVFFHTLDHAGDLTVAILAHTNGHQHRDVLHLATPRALQPDAIQAHVGVLALDRPVAASA